MIKSKPVLLIGLVALAALAMMGCEGSTGPQGPPGDAAGVTCTQCHDQSSQITAKVAQWEESLHGSGGAYTYAGGRSSCTGCHSGASFVAMAEAGLNPSEVEVVTAVTRQDCRTCHQIHKTGTDADWALTTTEAVDLYAYEDVSYDGGEGNLCVNCHQPRRAIAAAVDGEIEITSTHWGPHHGPQSAMLLGLGGAGATEGSSSAHYRMVDDTCVGCHAGAGDDHTFEPTVAACQGCHEGAEDFDIGGIQTAVQADLDELEAGLIDLGWLDDEGHPAVEMIPEDQAAALWNWIYIAHEDKSKGVHNPAYTRALLDAGLAALP